MGVNRRDGSAAVWVSVNAEPIFRNGETAPFGVVCSFRDVTERLAMEQELRIAKEAAELAVRSQAQGTAMLCRRVRPPVDNALALTIALIENGAGRFAADELMALERLRAQCRETLAAIEALSVASNGTNGTNGYAKP